MVQDLVAAFYDLGGVENIPAAGNWADSSSSNLPSQTKSVMKPKARKQVSEYSQQRSFSNLSASASASSSASRHRYLSLIMRSLRQQQQQQSVSYKQEEEEEGDSSIQIMALAANLNSIPKTINELRTLEAFGNHRKIIEIYRKEAKENPEVAVFALMIAKSDGREKMAKFLAKLDKYAKTFDTAK